MSGLHGRHLQHDQVLAVGGQPVDALDVVRDAGAPVVLDRDGVRDPGEGRVEAALVGDDAVGGEPALVVGAQGGDGDHGPDRGRGEDRPAQPGPGPGQRHGGQRAEEQEEAGHEQPAVHEVAAHPDDVQRVPAAATSTAATSDHSRARQVSAGSSTTSIATSSRPGIHSRCGPTRSRR